MRSILFITILAGGCTQHAARGPRVVEEPSNFQMPELRGLTVAQTEQRLRAAGKRGPIEWREERCAGELPIGAICSTYPHAGAHTMMREPLIVYVQAPRGPATPLPDVHGQPVDTARAALQSAGFHEVVVQPLDDPGCEPDRVCHVGAEHGYAEIPKTLYVGKQAKRSAVEAAAPPPPPPKPSPPKPSFFK